MQLRHLFAVAATALGFAASLFMLGRVIGFSSPWLVLLGMFCAMGLARVAEPIVMLRLPAGLYGVRPWEGAQGPYRRLGVFRFAQCLRHSPFRWLNPSVYLGAGRRDLQALRRQAASGEATHFWAAVLFAPYIGYLALRGHWALAALFLGIELIFNLYPILHLRSLRGRLDAVLGRARERVR
jgi:hypothetical protein